MQTKTTSMIADTFADMFADTDISEVHFEPHLKLEATDESDYEDLIINIDE